MRRLLVGLTLLLANVSFATGFGGGGSVFGAGSDNEFLPVEEAYPLVVEQLDDQHIRLYWQIAENYYLYRHGFKFAVTDDNGDVPFDAQLPQGLEKEDEYFGQVEVYYHSADVVLQLRQPVAEAIVHVTSQGCADAGLCYPPRKQAFLIDVVNGAHQEFDPAALPAQLPRNGQSETSNRPAADRDSTSPVSTRQPPAAPENPTSSGLWYMLLLAFLGGAILNLMPCVFPILSLKVLSFANSTDEDRHLHSLVYSAGVVLSFVAVAALLFALQRAGAAIGWGFQLQSPGFVIALAYLFIAMGLSLSGVFSLGGGLMNTGNSLASRSGLTGSFFTGVLAVVVASPCTAPFMGTALGFAISQPPLIGLLVFAALGAGMAAPLLLFGYSGAARAVMPKPGPWMNTLKEFLAFPLYATALWLLWVAGRQTGVNTLAATLCGALLLAFGLWLWNDRPWRKVLAAASIAGAVAFASMTGLDSAATDQPRSVQAMAWSDANVSTLRNKGKPVFVDVTADWCITCKANEARVLSTDDIRQAFTEHNVAFLVADWTNHDANIAALLERHQRSGIPLYLLYPADPTAAPIILPQILSKHAVLEALNNLTR